MKKALVVGGGLNSIAYLLIGYLLFYKTIHSIRFSCTKLCNCYSNNKYLVFFLFL